MNKVLSQAIRKAVSEYSPKSIEDIIKLPDPVGKVLEKWTQPNGLEFQQCVVMAPKTQLYYDVDCKETHCFFCSVCKQLHFFLRGLSEGLSKGDDNRNGIDSRYIYIPKFEEEEDLKSMVHLEGYYDHRINLNKAANQWEILRVDNGSVGTLSTEEHYPFGKHIWNVNNRSGNSPSLWS